MLKAIHLDQEVSDFLYVFDGEEKLYLDEYFFIENKEAGETKPKFQGFRTEVIINVAK
ncbi:MAG: hypothetical protein PHH57_07595 [Candidatus Omnitrophica bacterium]|nr:hypothetical protein [Candidatus Omnitrophota bacterium]